jgi:hypothetical protein
MKQTTEFEDACECVHDVPVSAMLSPLKPNRYGSVPGLDDEELADPYELERVIRLEEWGPILALPVKKGRRWIQPHRDEDGHIDFGAFGTVDFERGMPEFDKARYKAEKLGEERDDVLSMFGIVKIRLPEDARRLVLRYLKMGIIDLEHITHPDMLALAKYYLRARRLEKEIVDLKAASSRARERRLAAFLAD